MNLLPSFLRRSKPEPETRQPVVTRRAMVAQRFGRMFRAAQTDLATSGWHVTLTSADAELLVSNVAMRSRHRQLERDNALFRHILRLFQNNVIGHDGIKLEMKCRDKVGDENGRPKYVLDNNANMVLKNAWARAMRPENCTVRKTISGIQLQRLVVRCLKRDGGIILRKHRAFKNEFGFALEPIEIDRLDHWWNRPTAGTANQIKFGIERDQYGAPQAYWVLTRHPGDVFAFSSNAAYRERIPASDIIAVWDVERAEQTIGFSDMSATATPLHHLEEYILSENIAARLGADQGGWFEKEPVTSSDGYSGPQDESGNKIVDREPGTWEELPTGWKAKPNDPKHPTQAFPDFLKANQRLASIGSNISYNAAAGDLESVNYSSLKAGRLEDIEEYQTLQVLIRDQLLIPWFEDWLLYAILSGKVQLPINKMAKWLDGATWQFRTWKSVEPLKEVQADLEEIRNGLDSRRNKIQERGREIGEVDEEQAEDLNSERLHGLDYGEPDNVNGKAAVNTTLKADGDELSVPAGTMKEAAASGDSVQATALNGAQVTALIQAATEAANKGLPIETAKAICKASFPLVPEATLDAIFAPLKNFKQPEKPQAKVASVDEK